MRRRQCFQCEFCGKILLTKQAMKIHEEDICFYNPKKRACAICVHPFYLLGNEKEPYSGESKRSCKKGHNIEKSLRADCQDFLWLITAGHSNFYGEYYPGVIEKMSKCKHEDIGYTDGGPDAQKICKICGKIF